MNSGIWPLFFVIAVAESVLEPIREARWVRIGVCVALTAATMPLRFGAAHGLSNCSPASCFSSP
jgi:hypothetical protein